MLPNHAQSNFLNNLLQIMPQNQKSFEAILSQAINALIANKFELIPDHEKGCISVMIQHSDANKVFQFTQVPEDGNADYLVELDLGYCNFISCLVYFLPKLYSNAWGGEIDYNSLTGNFVHTFEVSYPSYFFEQGEMC